MTTGVSGTEELSLSWPAEILDPENLKLEEKIV